MVDTRDLTRCLIECKGLQNGKYQPKSPLPSQPSRHPTISAQPGQEASHDIPPPTRTALGSRSMPASLATWDNTPVGGWAALIASRLPTFQATFERFQQLVKVWKSAPRSHVSTSWRSEQIDLPGPLILTLTSPWPAFSVWILNSTFSVTRIPFGWIPRPVA